MVALAVCGIAVTASLSMYIAGASKSLVIQLYPISAENIETKAKLYIAKEDFDSFVLSIRKIVEDKFGVAYIHYIDKESKYAATTDDLMAGTTYDGPLVFAEMENGARDTRWLDGHTFEAAFPLFVQVSEYVPEEQAGGLVIGFNLDTVKASLDGVRNVSISIIALFSLIIAVVIVLDVRVIVARPLGALIRNLESLSKNEGDLTKMLPVRSKDEIGVLSGNFNDFLGSLGSMIKKMKGTIEGMVQFGRTLSASTIESSAAFEQIRANTESIKNNTVALDREVVDSGVMIGEVRISVDRISDRIATLNSNVNDSSTSVQDMLRSIEGVITTSEDGLAISETLQTLAAKGVQAIDETITIRPEPRSRMAGNAHDDTTAGAIRLTSS